MCPACLGRGRSLTLVVLPWVPGGGGGGGGVAAPGSVLTEAPFLWTSLSLLILPGDSGGHRPGAPAAPGPHPRNFLRSSDQALGLRGGGIQPLGDARG